MEIVHIQWPLTGDDVRVSVLGHHRFAKGCGHSGVVIGQSLLRGGTCTVNPSLCVCTYISTKTKHLTTVQWYVVCGGSFTEAHAQCGEVNTLRAITPQ